jgi:acyl phosphate:glycerol-3-phosphate acyltransferase
MTITCYFLAILAAYFVGSIPFGWIVAFFLKIDIRTQGSGNIGATNVGRVCGRKWGILVMILDIAKGYLGAGPFVWVAIYFAQLESDSLTVTGLKAICAVAVFCGHLWPLFLGFKGGKGVATAAGALLVLQPIALLSGLLVWGILLGLTRYMSVASMSGAAVAAIVSSGCSWYQDSLSNQWPIVSLTFILALLVFVRHRANIGRLLQGQELRLGSKKPSPATEDITEETGQ